MYPELILPNKTINVRCSFPTHLIQSTRTYVSMTNMQLFYHQNLELTVLIKLTNTCYAVLTGQYILLSVGLLARSQNASKSFRERPCRQRILFSSVFEQMLRWFPSYTLPLHACHAGLTTSVNQN